MMRLETAIFHYFFMFQHVSASQKCQVSRLTGKGGSQSLLSLPQSELLSELMATLLLRPVF